MVDGRKNGPMEGRMDGLMREQEGKTAKFPGVCRTCRQVYITSKWCGTQYRSLVGTRDDY